MVTGIEAERTDDRDRQIQKFEKKKTVQVFTSLRPYSHCSSDFFSKLSSISGYYVVFPVQNDGGRKLVARGGSWVTRHLCTH
jgi:hypothetical protein